MPKKKTIKRECRVVSETKTEETTSRKDELKTALLDLLEQDYPDKNRKFDINQIIAIKGTRGSLRDYLDGNLTLQDRYIVRDIFQELKNNQLLHIGGKWWTRI